MRHLFVFLLFLLFNACGEDDDSFSGQLAISDELEISDATLKLQDVYESRCPADVVCVHSGLAIAMFTTSTPDTFYLSTLPITEPIEASNTFEFNGYTVRLEEILPYPCCSDEPTEPEDFRVNLVVE